MTAPQVPGSKALYDEHTEELPRHPCPEAGVVLADLAGKAITLEAEIARLRNELAFVSRLTTEIRMLVKILQEQAEK